MIRTRDHRVATYCLSRLGYKRIFGAPRGNRTHRNSSSKDDASTSCAIGAFGDPNEI